MQLSTKQSYNLTAEQFDLTIEQLFLISALCFRLFIIQLVIQARILIRISQLHFLQSNQ